MAGFWNLSNSQIHDQNGKPLIGAKAYFYLGGTTTPITIYKVYGLGSANAHPNPVQTDGAGFFPSVFFDEANQFYRLRITTAAGVIIYDVDGIPIIGPNTGGGGGGGGDNPVDPNAIMTTGDMMVRYGEGLRPGFVRCNGRTVGSATSGASERANADAESLFNYLWNADPNLAVLGGRGTTPGADWSANKQMTLPDWRSKAIIGMDTMGNAAAGIIAGGSALGFEVGETAHTLALTEIPSHVHALSDPGHIHNWGNTAQGFGLGSGNVGAFAQGGPIPGGLNTTAAPTGITMSPAGGGLAHNNLQPSKTLTIYMRL